MTTAPVTVVVADADLPTRRGIRLLLQANDFRVCAETADGDGALDAVVRERPALCLVDAELPGGGIRAVSRIKSRVPEVSVIMLARAPREDELVEALRAGASGYLPKNADSAGLLRALHAVLRGEPAVPRSLLGPVVEALHGRGRGRRLSLPGRGALELTRRESQVLELLRQDLSTAEIADRLAISPVTVRRHVGSILHKLDVPDRRTALRLLREQA
jgi:DNA-binding NarL/FixJ family response regulator